MSRYARRVDANHAEIRQALQAIGAAVIDVHTTGGALDLLVGFRGGLVLMEVKDGAKVASKRKLTERERATMDLLARNDIAPAVVLSVDDALRAIGAV